MNDMMRLVEPLIPALRRYARSLLKDRAAADDLVQDCLERTITRWHQRRTDGDARTWVFTILHNLAINRRRQSARRGRHIPIDDMDEVAASERPAQDAVSDFERCEVDEHEQSKEIIAEELLREGEPRVNRRSYRIL